MDEFLLNCKYYILKYMHIYWLSYSRINNQLGSEKPQAQLLAQAHPLSASLEKEKIHSQSLP